MSGPSPMDEFAFVCCSIAAVALLAWDHIITLGVEVNRMWLSKPRGGTYIPLHVTALRHTSREGGRYVARLVVRQSPILCQACNIAVRFQIFPMILRTLAFSMFSALRVYALMKNKWPLAVFVFLLVLPSAITPAYVYAHQWATAPTNVYGCQLSYLASQPEHDHSKHPKSRHPTFACTHQLYFTVRIAGIIADLLSESIVIGVTLRKTLSLRGNVPLTDKSRPAISTLLLRDGTLYFVALMVLSIADMLVLIFDHVPAAVVGYDYWVVPYYTPVFRTIIICRFLLVLRHIFYKSDDEEAEDTHVGTLRFASRVVGDLGAPLEPLGFRKSNNSEDDYDDYDEASDVIYADDPFTAGMLASGSGTPDEKEKEKQNDSEYRGKQSDDVEMSIISSRSETSD